MSHDTGGWAGAILACKDSNKTTTGFGFYGGNGELNYFYFGGTSHSNPVATLYPEYFQINKSGNIIPKENNVYSLGNDDKKFSNLYVRDITCDQDIYARGFYGTSDIRLKRNIRPIEGALSIINNIKPCEWEWKNGEGKASGVIAQEIKEILPDIVHENNSYLTVDYNSLSAYEISAIKEMNEKIEEQHKEIEILKKEIAELKQIIKETIKPVEK